MTIYIGADHRGFALKEALKKELSEKYTVVDKGGMSYDEHDDYPDFAAEVAKAVAAAPAEGKGIVICGSGVGMDIVANKFKGVRSALAISANQVYKAASDDDVNVLALSADFINEDEAKKIVDIYLTTPFSGGDRFRRRLDKIAKIEGDVMK